MSKKCIHLLPKEGWLFCPFCGKSLISLSISSAFKVNEALFVAILQNKGEVAFDTKLLVKNDSAKIVPEVIQPGKRVVATLIDLLDLELFGKKIPAKTVRVFPQIILSLSGIEPIELIPGIDNHICARLSFSEKLLMKIKLPRELLEFTTVIRNQSPLARISDDTFLLTPVVAEEPVVYTIKIGALETKFKIEHFHPIIIFDNAPLNCPSDAHKFSRNPIDFSAEVNCPDLDGELAISVCEADWFDVQPKRITAPGAQLTYMINTTALSKKYPDTVYLIFKQDERIQIEPVRIKWFNRISEQAVIIGADFGTSYTCIALQDIDTSEIVPLLLPGLQTRAGELTSAVQFINFAQEEYGFGEQAAELYFSKPYMVARNFKALLASEKLESYFDSAGEKRDLSAMQVSQIYVKFLANQFFARYPYDPKSVTLLHTYPADPFGTIRMNILKVWKSTGIQCRTGPSEPVALFFAYRSLLENELSEGLYAMFDFGGHTADLSFFAVLGSEMDEQIHILFSTGAHYNENPLGGEYLTFLIAEELMSQTEKKLPFPDDWFEPSTWNHKQKNNFVELARRAKRYKETSEPIGTIAANLMDDAGHNIPVEFNPDEERLDEVIKNFINVGGAEVVSYLRTLKETFLSIEKPDETIKPIIEMFRKEKPLNAMILGGNSSRHPLVRKLFENANIAEKVIFNDKIAKRGVAEGLIYWTEYLTRINTNYVPFSVSKTVQAKAPLFQWGEPVPPDGIFRKVKVKLFAGMAKIALSSRFDNKYIGTSRTKYLNIKEDQNVREIELSIGFIPFSDNEETRLIFVIRNAKTDKEYHKIWI